VGDEEDARGRRVFIAVAVVLAVALAAAVLVRSGLLAAT
jgi:hypothetical protein